MARRYTLRDDQWNRMKDLLSGKEGTVGVTAKNNQLFVEAVLYRYRAGILWRDLPERFEHFRDVQKRHSRWSKTGVWEKVFQHLANDSDNEYQMIDSISVYGTSTLLSVTAVASKLRSCSSTFSRGKR